MRPALRAIGLALLLALTAGRYASAQITAATLSGVVADESGAGRAGAAITITNLETGLQRTTLSREDGSYDLPGLPPGVYDVRVALDGFAPAVKSRVVLDVAQHATCDLVLHVGLTERVEVSASTVVETKTSALSSLVDEHTIAVLPLNGRNFIDLALLQPGVVAFTARQSVGPTGRGQQINVNGADGRANSYLLDGANLSGYAGLAVATAADTTLGIDMIREFRVATNAFSADYGRAMGGVVSVVSKSGSNTAHGSGFEFFRDDALDARNFFDAAKPPFERHQFGFTAGGPIRRNRLFVFGGAEWLVEDLGLTQLTEVPSAAARTGPVAPSVAPYLALFPMPNGANIGDGVARYTFSFDRRTRETLAQVRVDYNLSPASVLFVRYTSDNGKRRQPTSLPQFVTEHRSDNDWLTIEEKHTLGAAALNTARFSSSRVDLSAAPEGGPADPALAFLPGQTLGNLLIGSREYGPERLNPQYQNVEYFTFSDDVAYSRAGQLIKAGVLIERTHTAAETSTSVRGRYSFPNVQRFLLAQPNRFIGVLPGYDAERLRRNTTFGFYVQDDITTRPRLTLNLGLRYEFYTVPNDVQQRDSGLRDLVSDRTFAVGPIFENPSLKNFGPRIGFAWDVAADRQTVVRGGAGVYYDTDGPFNSALLGAAFSPPFARSMNLGNPVFPRPPLEAVNGGAARGVDYDLRQPRMLSANLTVQRDVVPGVTVTASYAASRGHNLVQAIEGNPAVPQILADGTKFFPEGAPRQNPNWDSIDFRTTDGRSTYDALQLSASKRFSRRHRWQVSYTFGRVIDETQGHVAGDATNSSVYPQDPIDPRNDRGPADYDVRHVLAANMSWDIPASESLGGVARAIAHGWQVNGLVLLRSGVPFSPSIQSGTNWSRSGNTAPGAEDRPNVRAGIDADAIILGGITRYFDPNAFVLQPRGFLGNVPRNMLRGPGFATVNVALLRTIPWQTARRGGAIELRVEAFNLLNRANFGLPNRVVFAGAAENEPPLATAGQITTASDARQLQLGVKVTF